MGEALYLGQLESPLGAMVVCATSKGICSLRFADTSSLESESEALGKSLKLQVSQEDNEHIKLLKEELAAYFAGELTSFTIALHLIGTPFQQAVWQQLQTIPFGETSSYQQQTNRLGNPKAIRAVASANGKNKIAVIVPCHRVIGKSGSLTGYAGGLARKRWLLEHEACFGKTSGLQKSLLF